jgi:hypothetical protein
MPVCGTASRRFEETMVRTDPAQSLDSTGPHLPPNNNVKNERPLSMRASALRSVNLTTFGFCKILNGV